MCKYVETQQHVSVYSVRLSAPLSTQSQSRSSRNEMKTFLAQKKRMQQHLSNVSTLGDKYFYSCWCAGTNHFKLMWPCGAKCNIFVNQLIYQGAALCQDEVRSKNFGATTVNGVDKAVCFLRRSAWDYY